MKIDSPDNFVDTISYSEIIDSSRMWESIQNSNGTFLYGYGVNVNHDTLHWGAWDSLANKFIGVRIFLIQILFMDMFMSILLGVVCI